MLLLLATAALAGPCPATTADLLVSLDGAEAAWGVDEDAFAAAAAQLDEQLPCLADALTPALAARVHRVEGLSAWRAGAPDRAGAAFAAARSADPAYTFPEAMIPAANPVRRLYDASAPDTATAPLPPPRAGALTLDGVATRDRPLHRATVLQRTEHGAIAQTAWLPPDAPVPAYPRPGDGLRLPLLVGAGVAAAGAGVLYGLAAAQYADHPEPESRAEWQAIYQGNHRKVIGAAVLGVASVGTGATAFLYGRW